ncbi:hypothetical protein M8C21_019538 [Ambrosia artemisiifolia]|uniref:Uncharacterized protein n=1 Tax=Ambrosia artemisiifolia TaxID=4212 RepID=A0AAD5D919_AMBAR|nr:hypothetical protein M8C21_019538 [Ambrosia artemisiifolia]
MSSVNQSRRENNPPPHYRKPPRYANPNSPGNFTAGQSFKKAVSNAQGQQAWVSVGTKPNQNVSFGSSNSSQNGAYIQQPLRAISGTSIALSTGDVVPARTSSAPTNLDKQKQTQGIGIPYLKDYKVGDVVEEIKGDPGSCLGTQARPRRLIKEMVSIKCS